MFLMERMEAMRLVLLVLLILLKELMALAVPVPVVQLSYNVMELFQVSQLMLMVVLEDFKTTVHLVLVEQLQVEQLIPRVQMVHKDQIPLAQLVGMVLMEELEEPQHGTPRGGPAGMALRGKYIFISEGARGSLAKQLIAKFALDAGRDPQKFGIGLKEIWRAEPSRLMRNRSLNSPPIALRRELPSVRQRCTSSEANARSIASSLRPPISLSTEVGP